MKISIASNIHFLAIANTLMPAMFYIKEESSDDKSLFDNIMIFFEILYTYLAFYNENARKSFSIYFILVVRSVIILKKMEKMNMDGVYDAEFKNR